MSDEGKVALFFFAHQDDEFGVFQKIIEERQKGFRVCCAYMTDGGCPERRDGESLNIMQKLGVRAQDVFFVGSELPIPDGQLCENLERVAYWVNEWIASYTQVGAMYVPAWEGGHPDHDALHALVVSVVLEKGCTEKVWQFPLYNAYRCPSVFFKVLSPLKNNGLEIVTKISWINRFRFLSYCLSYPSQVKTWLGLFPFAIYHYFFNGSQVVQPVSKGRVYQRPHEGRLYYEKRGFLTWEKMVACLCQWWSSSSVLNNSLAE